MPLICKDMVDLLDNNSTDAVNQSSLSDYAFLYGVFPTAPSVAIYAVYYNAELQVVSCASSCYSSLTYYSTFYKRTLSSLKGDLWDGDQHFPLSSYHVCFSLVADGEKDGYPAGDELVTECQL